jgi:hypothetical protein
VEEQLTGYLQSRRVNGDKRHMAGASIVWCSGARSITSCSLVRDDETIGQIDCLPLIKAAQACQLHCQKGDQGRWQQFGYGAPVCMAHA